MALETPKWGSWGQTQERAYNLNDNVSRDLYSTFVHKNNFFFSIRGHLQHLEVNSRTFDDILAWKRTFLADILHLSYITRNRCMINTGYNILPVLLCCQSILKRRHDHPEWDFYAFMLQPFWLWYGLALVFTSPKMHIGGSWHPFERYYAH